MKNENQHLKSIDFHHVEPKHYAIHVRLENWARWAADGRANWISPMFKMARSNARQWHAPEIRPQVDTLDAAAIERAVGHLPHDHRFAVRWAYVFRTKTSWPRRELGVTEDGLFRLLCDGRQMLINRQV